jgi:hypothetical protein
MVCRSLHPAPVRSAPPCHPPAAPRAAGASALLLVAWALPLGAAESDPVHIDRWGSTLIITAPAGSTSGAAAAGAGERISVDWTDTSLVDAVADLRQRTDATLIIDPAVQARASAITLHAQDMALGSVLHWLAILGKTHCSYVDEAWYFSDRSVPAASVTRLYDVSDLVMTPPDFPGPELVLAGLRPAAAPPARADQPAADQIDQLVALINRVVIAPATGGSTL